MLSDETACTVAIIILITKIYRFVSLYPPSWAHLFGPSLFGLVIQQNFSTLFSSHSRAIKPLMKLNETVNYTLSYCNRFLSLPKRVTFVYRLVLLHNYTETTDWISTQLGWRMCFGPEQTPLTYGAGLGLDLDKGMEPVHFLEHCGIAYFSNFPGNNAWILI